MGSLFFSFLVSLEFNTFPIVLYVPVRLHFIKLVQCLSDVIKKVCLVLSTLSKSDLTRLSTPWRFSTCLTTHGSTATSLPTFIPT